MVADSRRKRKDVMRIAKAPNMGVDQPHDGRGESCRFALHGVVSHYGSSPSGFS